MTDTKEINNVITINGTDYTDDQLSVEQKYYIAQIRDLQAKADAAKFQLDQATVAKDTFVNALIKSLEPETTEETAPEVIAQ
jgi:uncharacterized protein YheU (UPF0270 family)